MNAYVTGAAIRQLREKQNLTQAQLAMRIGVSSKAISKWETAKGLPDVSLLQPLAQALNISVIELMNGEHITNNNVSANLLRTQFYVCPVCGNVIYSVGRSVISCCGITLPAAEAEAADAEHTAAVTIVEDEYYIKVNHPMTKAHFISFMAYVTTDRIQLVKLYPEGGSESRFKISGKGIVYWYCKQHGLFQMKL